MSTNKGFHKLDPWRAFQRSCVFKLSLFSSSHLLTKEMCPLAPFYGGLACPLAVGLLNIIQMGQDLTEVA